MAERLLFIGWDSVVYGREERGLEVFNEAVGLWGRMQQDGRIEKFDVVLLRPHGDGIAGYMELLGSVEQLAAVREDAEFLRLVSVANLVTEGMCTVEGFTNEGIAPQMEIYREAVASVPQSV